MKTIFKFLPALAIVVGMAASAFTSAKPVESKNKTFANYYWYEVDASGNVLGTVLNPSGTISKAAAMSLSPTECTDVTARPFCKLGSNSSTLDEDDQITSPPADAIIRRNAG